MQLSPPTHGIGWQAVTPGDDHARVQIALRFCLVLKVSGSWAKLWPMEDRSLCSNSDFLILLSILPQLPSAFFQIAAWRPRFWRQEPMPLASFRRKKSHSFNEILFENRAKLAAWPVRAHPGPAYSKNRRMQSSSLDFVDTWNKQGS